MKKQGRESEMKRGTGRERKQRAGEKATDG
uniref:Uncharacterized protein n=1 Tax=Anguilla anguilla TaxID=7936 RepID=A0A0E9QLF4_ANGAN